MITFMVSSDYSVTAGILDRYRLLQQMNEAVHIINSITTYELVHEYDNGDIVIALPKNSQAVYKEWMQHITSLQVYFNVMRREWTRRGYNYEREEYDVGDESKVLQPLWTYWSEVHYSHMSRLKQKNPNHYSGLVIPDEYINCSYVWPSKHAQYPYEHPNSIELKYEKV